MLDFILLHGGNISILIMVGAAVGVALHLLYLKM